MNPTTLPPVGTVDQRYQSYNVEMLEVTGGAFSKPYDARIVSSFAVSPGTRDINGVWSSDTARRWLDYTRSIGGDIAAAKFMNEPTMATMGGAPEGYDAAAYGRDFKEFTAFASQPAPSMIILGPGSVGETPCQR